MNSEILSLAHLALWMITVASLLALIVIGAFHFLVFATRRTDELFDQGRIGTAIIFNIVLCGFLGVVYFIGGHLIIRS